MPWVQLLCLLPNFRSTDAAFSFWKQLGMLPLVMSLLLLLPRNQAAGAVSSFAKMGRFWFNFIEPSVSARLDPA